jgi:hypothetical protein
MPPEEGKDFLPFWVDNSDGERRQSSGVERGREGAALSFELGIHQNEVDTNLLSDFQA